MKKRNLRRVVAALLMLQAFACLMFGGGTKLAYGFQNQTMYRYRTVLTMSAPENTSTPPGTPAGSTSVDIRISLSKKELASNSESDFTIVIDELGVKSSAPDGTTRNFPFDELKGKSVCVTMNDQGSPKALLTAVSADAKMASQRLGMDLFSKDVLGRLLICLELPGSPVEAAKSWQYSRSDTVSRDPMRLAVTRSAECRLVGDDSVGGRLCRKIAFSVVTRFHSIDVAGSASGSMKGQTTATGAFYLSSDGIPIKASAEMKSEMLAGNGEATMQSGRIATTLE